MSETMTNEWPAIMSDYLKAMSAIEQRFQSGNEIPVPDARITRAEWEALDRYSLEDEARSTDAGMAYMHLEEERDALRAEAERLAKALRGMLEAADVIATHFGIDPESEMREYQTSAYANARAALAAHGALPEPPAERGEG